jgi:hypothetical protein
VKKGCLRVAANHREYLCFAVNFVVFSSSEVRYFYKFRGFCRICLPTDKIFLPLFARVLSVQTCVSALPSAAKQSIGKLTHYILISIDPDL